MIACRGLYGKVRMKKIGLSSFPPFILSRWKEFGFIGNNNITLNYFNLVEASALYLQATRERERKKREGCFFYMKTFAYIASFMRKVKRALKSK